MELNVIKRITVVCLTLVMLFSAATISFADSTNATDSGKDAVTYSDRMVLKQFVAGLEESRTIRTYKTITDFEDNNYIVVECDPIGYVIYQPSSKEVVEYSEYSQSPYYNYSGDLKYCGPTEYYYNNDSKGEYVNTISKETISSDMEELYSSASKALKEQLESDGNAKDRLATDKESLEKNNSYTYVDHKSFIENLDTKDKMGYFYKKSEGGVCGYIAAGIVLLYHDKYYNNSFIVNSTYLANQGKEFKDNSFTRHLYYTIGKSVLNYDNSLTAGQAANVMKKYLSRDRNISINYWSITGPSESIIKDKIKNTKKPLIYENKFTSPKDDSSETVHHDVVIYGYNSKYLVAHFGWEDYSNVKCNGKALAVWNNSASGISYY